MAHEVVLDAHVHLWDPLRLHYDWLKSHAGLNQPHQYLDFRAAVGDLPVRELLFVQADCRPDEGLAEAQWVAEMAQTIAPIRGIVAFAPVDLGDDLRYYLASLTQLPLVRGVRRLIQGERHADIILRPSFVRGVQICAEFGLTFDICITHGQFPQVIQLVERCPDVTFVLDHLGKPDVKHRHLDPWRTHLRELAAAPNVACKLSGLITEADHRHWQPADLQPYLAHAVDCFGPDRILFGSDWPVCTLAGGYRRWWDALQQALATLPGVDPAKLFGGNARRLYRLAPVPAEA